MSSSEPNSFPALLARPFARLAYNRWGNKADNGLDDLDLSFNNVVEAITNVPTILSCLAISPIAAVDFIIEPILPHRKFLSARIATRIFEDKEWLDETISSASDYFFDSVRAHLPRNTETRSYQHTV